MLEMNALIRNFLFPAINRRFLIRVAIVTISAWMIFKYLLIPLQVKGYSMAPTYNNGDVNFCWTLRYMLSPPKRYDIVAVRYAGTRVMLLKRVIALAGESVEFKSGRLYINGREIKETYVKNKYNWNLVMRTVKPNHVYVVGDNRNVPMETHDFGQTDVNRIVGAPLW
jgi:signal peptidase I